MHGPVGRAVCQVGRHLKRQDAVRARGRGARQKQAAFRPAPSLGAPRGQRGRGR